ncbi:MAG: hypothetical protein ACTSX8_02385 [Alphaproteobacteria bacterium]
MSSSKKEEPCFYVLDAREVVGNCASWWRQKSNGYSCNLREAGLYTATEVAAMRDTDIPIHRDIVEDAAVSHVRWDHLRARGVVIGGASGNKAKVRELEERLADAAGRADDLKRFASRYSSAFLIAFLRWLNANPHQVERLQALRRDLEMDELGALDLVDDLVKRSVAEWTPI